MTGHEWALWVLAVASGLHVVEEHALGWQGWAAKTLGPRLSVIPTWSDFWATNGALILVAIAASVVGWRAPAFALAFPALCIINALFFHLLPSIWEHRPNPGLFTAVALYLPIGVWVYVAAGQDDVLDVATLLGSVAIGAALMASAVGALLLKKGFAYPDSDQGERAR